MNYHSLVLTEIYFWALDCRHDTLAFPRYVFGGQVVIETDAFIPWVVLSFYIKMFSVAYGKPSGFNSEIKNLCPLPIEWLSFSLFHTHLPRIGLRYYCRQQEWTDKTRSLSQATQRLNVSVVYLHRSLVHRRKLFYTLGPRFIFLVLVTWSVQCKVNSMMLTLLNRIHGFNVTILETFSNICLMSAFCHCAQCLT